MELALDVADGASRVQRACDACRSRKIRCDRQTPCSNCKASRLTCQTNAPMQKAQKQRVHISEEYEKKIDRIEDRLGGIETVLEKLALKLSNLDIHTDTATESSSHTKSTATGTRIGKSLNHNEAHESAPPPFEGDTTLNSQSVFAHDFLEQAVGTVPSIGQNAKIKTALASLHAMVSRQKESMAIDNEPQPVFQHYSDIDVAKLELPPWEDMLDVFEKASTYPTMSFVIVFPFLKLPKIKSIAEKMFRSPEESSPARCLLVYGVLHSLFDEFGSFPLRSEPNEKCRQYSEQCRRRMEVAMTQISLLLPASHENISALVLAATHAVELSRPTLCWTMNSAAAALCQHLGYHRISTMKHDSEEERAAKVDLFWYVYTMDKQLSLRLGRSSIIQDWDMSLPMPGTIDVEASQSDDQLNNSFMDAYWIKVAQIQGQTYERLFSPTAFLKPAHERAQIAEELVNDLSQAWNSRRKTSVLDFVFQGTPLREHMPKTTFVTPKFVSPDQTDPRSKGHRATSNYPDLMQSPVGADSKREEFMKGSLGSVDELFYHADTLTHYSTATLIQRAVSPDNVTFTDDCLKSARAALVAHQRANEKFNVHGNEGLWTGYIHWSVLQAPFTPFIVLFCNAIAACDYSDLSTLSDFVLSLESCRTVSEGANKLYKMCQIFHRVAKLYVEAKSKEAAQQRHNPQRTFYATSRRESFQELNTMNQLDPYLSALGLMPTVAWPLEADNFNSIPSGIEAFQDMGEWSGDGAGGQNTVQDWFSGSRYIMGLMEDDISMPDFGPQ